MRSMNKMYDRYDSGASSSKTSINASTIAWPSALVLSWSAVSSPFRAAVARSLLWLARMAFVRCTAHLAKSSRLSTIVVSNEHFSRAFTVSLGWASTLSDARFVLRSRFMRFGGFQRDQSSTSNPPTRSNSPILLVITVRSRALAWPAMSMSYGPIGVPLAASCARISPAVKASR